VDEGVLGQRVEALVFGRVQLFLKSNAKVVRGICSST
jgi:hypothetical protein